MSCDVFLWDGDNLASLHRVYGAPSGIRCEKNIMLQIQKIKLLFNLYYYFYYAASFSELIWGLPYCWYWGREMRCLGGGGRVIFPGGVCGGRNKVNPHTNSF